MLLSHFPDPDILLNKDRMAERQALARDNALPVDVLLAVSETYTGIAERITGSTIPLSSDPRGDIIDVLAAEFGVIE